jgi:hypothetical protein
LQPIHLRLFARVTLAHPIQQSEQERLGSDHYARNDRSSHGLHFAHLLPLRTSSLYIMIEGGRSTSVPPPSRPCSAFARKRILHALSNSTYIVMFGHWRSCDNDKLGYYAVPQLLFVAGAYGEYSYWGFRQADSCADDIGVYLPLFFGSLWASWQEATRGSDVMQAVSVVMLVAHFNMFSSRSSTPQVCHCDASVCVEHGSRVTSVSYSS